MVQKNKYDSLKVYNLLKDLKNNKNNLLEIDLNIDLLNGLEHSCIDYIVKYGDIISLKLFIYFENDYVVFKIGEKIRMEILKKNLIEFSIQNDTRVSINNILFVD